jgi:hypothetical protein
MAAGISISKWGHQGIFYHISAPVFPVELWRCFGVPFKFGGKQNINIETRNYLASQTQWS